MSAPAVNPVHTLLIEPDAAEARRLLLMLGRAAPGEFSVEHEATAQAGVDRIDEKPFALVVLSCHGPDAAGDVRLISTSAPEAAIVAIAPAPGPAFSRACISEGAQDTLSRPELTDVSLVRSLRNAVWRQRSLLGVRAQVLDARAGEARFRNLIVQSADGLVVMDRIGTVKFLNRSAEELFGRSAAEMTGRRLDIPLDTGGLHEIDVAQEAEAVSNGSPVDLRSSTSRPQTYRVRSMRFVVAEVRVFEAEWAGEPVYVATLREVTSRKRAEQERLALAGISRAVNQDLDLAAVYERIGDEVAKLLRYERFEISLSRELPDDARIVHVRGVELEGMGAGARRPDGGREGFGSWMEVPLGASAKPAGYLGAGVRRAGVFTERDSDLFERIASQVYPAINNARQFVRASQLAGLSLAGAGDGS